MSKNISIMIVEDHPVVRVGLRAILETQEDFSVCCEAKDESEALHLLEKHNPDLVVADVSLHGANDMSGIELTKRIRSARPHTPVLVVSMHDESIYAERALHAGALGFLMKMEPPDKLVEAARQVLNGEVYVSPQVASRILKKTVGEQNRPGLDVEQVLTDRELEIFRLIGRGLSTQKIARQLELSPRTVDTHRQRVKEKLNLKSSQDLSEYATDWIIANITEQLLGRRPPDNES